MYFSDEFERSLTKSPDPSETSNLLENSQQYVKCGESNKLIETVEDRIDAVLEGSPINTNTEGYETPVKTRRSSDMKTPTNECPQYYTNMDAARTIRTDVA